MAEKSGIFGWVTRLNDLSTLIASVVAAAVAIIGYFGGVTHGENKQLAQTQARIDQLSNAVPESQRSRTAPVFNAIREAVTNGSPTTQSTTETSKLAQNIANAVTGLPTSTFSVGTSRLFSVGEQKTALVCGDRYHVGYGGPSNGIIGDSLVLLDGERWSTKPGNSKTFPNGVGLTLMQIENKIASFDVKCN